jgi:hypothetical protein
MNEVKVEQLIEVLIPLLVYWEYAEDIIAKLREWTVSDNEIGELTEILSTASDTAKTDEDFIRMTIAYEISNFWKKKEQTDNLNRQNNGESTLHLLDAL